MKKLLLLLFSLSILLSEGCRKPNDGHDLAHDILQKEEAFYEIYLGKDINSAKKAVDHYIKCLEEVEVKLLSDKEQWFIYYRHALAIARRELILACQKEKLMDFAQAIVMLKSKVIGFQDKSEASIKESLILILRNDAKEIDWITDFENLIKHSHP